MKKTKIIATSLVLLLCFSVLAPTLSWAAGLSQKYNLTVSGGYLKGVPAEVTVDELISFVNPSATISFPNGKQEYVCTGCVVNVGSDSYTVVVLGDVDGSGTVDATDYLKVKMFCIGSATLQGCYFFAADADGSGEIEITDYLRIKGHFLGSFDLFEDSYVDDENSSEDSASSEASSESSSEEDTSTETTGGGTIHFTASSVKVSGVGVSASGTTATITAAGEYTVTGSCSNGSIVVKAGDEDNVKLNLSGVTLSSSEIGPIFFESAKNGHIILAEGTTNTLSDSAVYTNGAKAAVFAECDLKIKGSGSLTVTGNYKHAIASDDEIFFDG